MVDPNRKINRLTAEDIAFLDECEELFGNRFTSMDDEFRAHCELPFPSPPVVTNFTGDRGERSGSGQNHSYRGRFNDNWQNYRGGRGGRQRNFNRNHNSYNRRGGVDAVSDGGYRQNYRSYRNNNRERNEDRANNVRREYGKFVAATNSHSTTTYKNESSGQVDNG